ncbi:hypothetical protein IWZ01DRAFT_263549 [Phyllosticta capitalensis]
MPRSIHPSSRYAVVEKSAVADDVLQREPSQYLPVYWDANDLPFFRHDHFLSAATADRDGLDRLASCPLRTIEVGYASWQRRSLFSLFRRPIRFLHRHVLRLFFLRNPAMAVQKTMTAVSTPSQPCTPQARTQRAQARSCPLSSTSNTKLASLGLPTRKPICRHACVQPQPPASGPVRQPHVVDRVAPPPRLFACLSCKPCVSPLVPGRISLCTCFLCKVMMTDDFSQRRSGAVVLESSVGPLRRLSYRTCSVTPPVHFSFRTSRLF